MSWKSMTALVVVFAVAGISVYVATNNKAPVTVHIPGVQPFSAPLWSVSFSSLMGGIFIALLYTLALSSREAIERWKVRRRELQAAEAERLYKQGLDATLEEAHAQALARFEEVVKRQPERLEAWILGGNAARSLGDRERATEMHLCAQGMAPQNPRVLAALAADFEASGDPERALGYLRRLIDAGSQAQVAPYARIRELLSGQRRWEEALEAQQEVMQLTRESGRQAAEKETLLGLQLEKGWDLLGEGQEQEAAAAAMELVKDTAEFEPGYLLLADARLAAGNIKAAREAWAQGFKATGSLQLLRRLVSHLLDAEEPDAAIETLRGAIEGLEKEKALAARLMLGRLYYRLEMLDAAKVEFDALEEQLEYAPTVQYYVAKLRRRKGEAEQAFDTLKVAVRQAGFLDSVFVCSSCRFEHSDYVRRCDRCGRWGTVTIDVSRELRGAAKAPVLAPQV